MGPEFFLNARNYRILYSNKNDNIERGKLTIEETKQLEENPWREKGWNPVHNQKGQLEEYGQFTYWNKWEAQFIGTDAHRQADLIVGKWGHPLLNPSIFSVK